MLVAPGSQFSSRPALAGLPRPTPRPVVTHPRASWTSTTRLVRVPGPRLHFRPPSPRRRVPRCRFLRALKARGEHTLLRQNGDLDRPQ